MDKYSQEVMIALTSDNYSNSVNKYLLSFDMENWKILAENYYKLTPYEADRILDEISKKLDFHMIIDLLSLAHIIGQSINLSTALISRLTKVNIQQYETHITKNIEHLLRSPIAEERRIGIFMAGFFDRDEFFDEIEKMTNYDILFEDAYFALGLLSNPKVIESLGNKFMNNNHNLIQRLAIAKILIQKGNPLAALWLYRNKGFDFSTSYTKAIYLARELVWAGLKPANFLTSNDDFIQPITIRFVEIVSSIFIYDIEIIGEIELEKVVKTLMEMVSIEPNLDLIQTIYAIKIALQEIYPNIDPYSISKTVRTNIINSWKLIKDFPKGNIIEYLTSYVKGNLSVKNDDFLLILRLIRNFKLKEFEFDLLHLTLNEKLTSEQVFELVSCLGHIGGEQSLNYILDLVNKEVNFYKRCLNNQEENAFVSENEYTDDFDNELMIIVNQTFELDVLKWFNSDFNEILYCNIIYNLGNIQSQKAIPILIEAFDDYNPKIRYQAIKSVAQQGILNKTIEDKLLSLATQDVYLNIQREAIITLGALHSQKAAPFLLKLITDAIQDKILELSENVEHVDDNRWEVDENIQSSSLSKDGEEIGTAQKISDDYIYTNKEQFIENDIARWLNRINKESHNFLELREDLQNNEDELSEEIEYFDDSEPFLGYEENSSLNAQKEEETDDEEEEEEEEWLADLNEQFKRITLVESAIEAMKKTEASLPIIELKAIIEYSSIDEELYKDILVILAKKGIPFAKKELIGFYNEMDYYRAREIARILVNDDEQEFEAIKKKTKNNNIDWVLQEIISKKQKKNI